MDSPAQDFSGQRAMMPKILWLAITVSLFIYCAIGLIVRSTGQTADNTNILPTLIPMLMGIAFIDTILVLFLVKKLIKGKNFFTFLVVRLALSEAIGIFGLVLYFLGADLAVFLGFLIWSLILMIICFPSKAAHDKYMGIGARGLPEEYDELYSKNKPG